MLLIPVLIRVAYRFVFLGFRAPIITAWIDMPVVRISCVIIRYFEVVVEVIVVIVVCVAMVVGTAVVFTVF
jgi:hypothetical protein